VIQLASKIPVVLLISLIFFSGCFVSPAEFEVVSLQITEPVVANEAFDVRAEVINKGGREGIYTAVLKIDGTEIDIKDIKIPAGNSQEVLFNVTLEEPAIRTLEIGGSTTTIKILKPAELGISKLKASPTLVLPGEEVIVTATAINLGEVKRSLKAILYVNGEEKDSQIISLKPGDIEDISFPLETDSPGNLEVDISGNRSKPINVRVYDVASYHNTEYDFSIMHPAGWQIEEYPGRVIIQKSAQTKLTIDIKTVSADNSLEYLYNSNIGAMTPKSPDPQIAWLETIGTTGEDALKLRYRASFTYKDSSGGKIHRNLSFSKFGTNFYIVMLETSYSDYHAGNMGLYDTCVKSFRSPNVTGVNDK
jgi:hypothetical protein